MLAGECGVWEISMLAQGNGGEGIGNKKGVSKSFLKVEVLGQISIESDYEPH